LVDLTSLPDKTHEEITRHLQHAKNELLSQGHAAGYALVVWNMDGTIGTSFWAARGSIGRSLTPAVVHDALLKRITVLEALEETEDAGEL
jgi:hypothetical protein